MEAKKTKVYIYTRVSTDMQVDGYSLDAQKDKLKKYADYNDMVIVGEYSDEGKSGKNIAGRPDFQRMLNDIACKKDDVKFVLVFKLSRFGRNTADTLNSLQYIQDFGVNLISTEDKIDSSEGTGKLMISVLSAVAEIERENILVQTMAGRKQKAREGKWNGGFAPYGYKLNKETSILEIAEDEAEAIRIIFDKFVHTDMGYNGVVTYLNNNGIKKKARQNGHLTSFTTSTVKAILDNPVYAGKIAYERRKNTKIEGTRNEYHIVPQKEYPVYDGKHEAIIDVKLWQDAQAKRKATAKRLEKKHGIDHEHVLSGIIKCPVCGAGMYGNRKTAKKKDGTYYPTYYSYACKHRTYKNGHKCDYHKQWNESKVDEAVAEIIKKLVQNPRFSEVMKTKINTKVDTAEAERELENARKMLRQAEGVKDKIISQLDSLDVLDKNYDRKYDDMQKRLDSSYEKISEAEELISICEDKLYNIQKDKITSTNIYNYLVMFESIYDDLTDMEKKQFYNTLLHEVQVFEEEQDNGQIIKSMRFKFPVYYNGEFTDTIFRDKKETVETVCLLSKLNTKQHIEVDIHMDELDLTDAEKKATYGEIKDYVLEHTGLKVSSLYIAQVKQKYGIIERENYNKPKSEDARQPQCPPDKEKAIKEALLHFGMI